MVGLWRRLGGSKDGWIAMAVVMMLAADDAEEQMQTLLQNIGRFRLGKVLSCKTPKAKCAISIRIRYKYPVGTGSALCKQVH